jgi:phosphoenolpyruvate carboxykinase (ATP)
MFKQTAPDSSVHDTPPSGDAMVRNGPGGEVRVNAPTALLFAEALRRGEGVVASNGALRVLTGERTGRSPRDRFIVQESVSASHIDWGPVNLPFDQARFESLWDRSLNHLFQRGDYFTTHLRAGAD